MRESEYTVDRLRAEVKHYKDIADTYEKEYQTLQSECLFGATVALLAGLVLGIAIGTVMSWA